MSQVKFEKETVRAMTGGKEDFIHKIGEAVTKSSGADGYLAVSTYMLYPCSALRRVAEARVTREARS
jgi:hypothetical protein